MSVVRYGMREGSYHVEMHGRTNKAPRYFLREWRTLELGAAQCELSSPPGASFRLLLSLLWDFRWTLGHTSSDNNALGSTSVIWGLGIC